MSKHKLDVLNDREVTYGDFREQADLIEGIYSAIDSHRQGMTRLNAVQAEAIRQIITKIARIINGNPAHADNWLDIAGYANLAITHQRDYAWPPAIFSDNAGEDLTISVEPMAPWSDGPFFCGDDIAAMLDLRDDLTKAKD